MSLIQLAAVLSILAMVVPPRMAALRAWFSSNSIDLPEEVATAAQAGLLNACLVSVLALAAAGCVGVVLESNLAIGAAWASGPALVLVITAAVASSAVSFPGSSTRRASLAPRGVGDLAPARTLRAMAALSVVVPAAAVVFASAYRGRTRPIRIYPELSAGPWLPAQHLGLFVLVLASSVLLSAVGVLALRRTLHRPAFSQAGGEVDLALRRLLTRRITAGVLSGQLILLAATAPGVQLLTLHAVTYQHGRILYTVSEAAQLSGVIVGSLTLAAGLAIWVGQSGLFLPWSPALSAKTGAASVPADTVTPTPAR